MRLPTRSPIWTMLAVLVGLACCFWIGKAWLRWWATPGQATYIGAYVKSSVVLYQKQTVTVMGKKYPARAIHGWLDADVFDHGHALRVPMYTMGSVLLLAFLVGTHYDKRRRKRLFEDGVRIRGPELLSVRRFNQRRKGDGLELVIK